MKMLFFTTPKNFKHYEVPQRNCLESLGNLKIDKEILVFADKHDNRCLSICKELGIGLSNEYRRADSGVPFVNDIFARAMDHTEADCYCYINCDMMLFNDFSSVMSDIYPQIRNDRFFMCGSKWEWPSPRRVDFKNEVESDIMSEIKDVGQWGPPLAIDYFIFSKDTFQKDSDYFDWSGKAIPDFLIAREKFDNSILHYARNNPDINDITFGTSVMAVHQEHEYEGGYRNLRSKFSSEFEHNVDVFNSAGGWNGYGATDQMKSTVVKCEHCKKSFLTGW